MKIAQRMAFGKDPWVALVRTGGCCEDYKVGEGPWTAIVTNEPQGHYGLD
ncbi:MAG: hypothetical protein HW389_2699 [Bacteroidetes bacterium]|nr:hypothetical protein [Bacteroidota bacterium]